MVHDFMKKHFDIDNVLNVCQQINTFVKGLIRLFRQMGIRINAPVFNNDAKCELNDGAF